jgi:hypothetical protein
MPKKKNGKIISMGTPATYRIRVQGFLVHGWIDRLNGMRVITVSTREEEPTTTLEGGVKDQAELIGLMNTLYELHMSILSVDLLSFG